MVVREQQVPYLAHLLITLAGVEAVLQMVLLAVQAGLAVAVLVAVILQVIPQLKEALTILAVEVVVDMQVHRHFQQEAQELSSSATQMLLWLQQALQVHPQLLLLVGIVFTSGLPLGLLLFN
jgi:hypothetical protein